MGKDDLLRTIGFSEKFIEKLNEYEAKNPLVSYIPQKQNLKSTQYGNVDISDCTVIINNPLYQSTIITQ